MSGLSPECANGPTSGDLIAAEPERKRAGGSVDRVAPSGKPRACASFDQIDHFDRRLAPLSGLPGSASCRLPKPSDTTHSCAMP